MSPSGGRFPRRTPAQLGYPDLTPAQLADPNTPVLVNGVTLQLWQIGHVYGVQFEATTDGSSRHHMPAQLQGGQSVPTGLGSEGDPLRSLIEEVEEA